jgi:hypothetical protein
VTHAGNLWHRLFHYACTLGLAIESQTARWLLEHRPPQAESRQFAETFFTPRLELEKTRLSASERHGERSPRTSTPFDRQDP